MKTLAERLRTCREELGLTQTELARKAHLKNQSIIGSLESGHRKTSSHLPSIAFALGVESLWLATGSGKKKRETVQSLLVKQPALDGMAEQPAYFLSGMSEPHRDAVLEMANTLYNLDNPQDKRANPFSHVGKAKQKEPQ